jgi:RND family efflux transporter MFP subunit
LLVGVLVLCTYLLRGQLAALGLPAVEVQRLVERDPGSVAAATGTSANGYIVARTRAALSADTPGRIVEMNVVEGVHVQRGEVVARLFADEYAAALQQAKASVVVAEKGIVRAQAEVEAARRELDTLAATVEATHAEVAASRASLDWSRLSFERAARLLAQGVDTADRRDRAQRDLLDAEAREQAAVARAHAAEKALLQSEARLAVAEAGVPEAEARLLAAAAATGLAQATLDKTAVRAPFDGVVVLKDAEVGEVVSPNSQGGSNARGSVVTMVDFSTLEVQAEVPETTLASVQLGGSARIYLDAYPTKPYLGRVDRIWPTANRTKATVEVRVVFEERDELLRPEMGVRVVFGAGDGGATLSAESRLLIPEGSLLRGDGAVAVFVVEGDLVRRREVTLGDARAGKVAVLSGLSAGEELVLEPGPELTDGMRVRVTRTDS